MLFETIAELNLWNLISPFIIIILLVCCIITSYYAVQHNKDSNKFQNNCVSCLSECSPEDDVIAKNCPGLNNCSDYVSCRCIYNYAGFPIETSTDFPKFRIAPTGGYSIDYLLLCKTVIPNTTTITLGDIASAVDLVYENNALKIAGETKYLRVDSNQQLTITPLDSSPQVTGYYVNFETDPVTPQLFMLSDGHISTVLNIDGENLKVYLTWYPSYIESAKHVPVIALSNVFEKGSPQWLQSLWITIQVT